MLFGSLFFGLRAAGVKVSTTEWLTLMEALVRGHARSSLETFYELARALLVKREAQYDIYDQVFASVFKNVPMTFAVDDELMKWLADPVLPRALSDEERAMLEAWDLDKLRDELEKRRREQTARHDGGNRWIGTGGTSPFGHGGQNPAGVRIGGSGGGRSAVQIAETRRFANLRSDRVLDTREMGTALKRLRKLAKTDNQVELDLEATIDKSARDGGDIDLVFSPPRANRVKLLLLIDVGGSMDPHAQLCERLFSAAHAAKHFKAFKHFFFHNCVYRRLYTDMYRFSGTLTTDVLKEVDQTWSMIVVGDAWMSPYELTDAGGIIDLADNQRTTGLMWLRRLREKVPNSVWLNPEPKRIWNADSVRMIRDIFPMFELTLDGLGEATDVLRGAKPNVADTKSAPGAVPTLASVWNRWG